MNFLLSCVLFLLSFNAFAIECFEFKFSDFPDGAPIPLDGRLETWCYKTIDHSNFKTLIFNYDGKDISKNLAILVDKEQNYLFYDQLFGEVRVIEQNGLGSNPYQIPLSTIKMDKKYDGIKVSIDFTEEQIKEIEKIPQQMLAAKRKIIDEKAIKSIKEEIVDEEVYLPEDLMPVDGYWWPYRNSPMANPEFAPTKIYDLYVKTKTGTDPKSTEWELANHSLDETYWGGHCNGWAASSVLYGFLEDYLILDPGQGRDPITIEPYQIQGLRTETSFCVKTAFYGHRYRVEGDDPKDISPDRFHEIIRYYLKELGKPVFVDRIALDPVDNSIITGYQLKVTKGWGNDYKVTAKMRVHFYSYTMVYAKKPTVVKDVTYNYTLTTDESGRIVSGEWDMESPNPDFLWAVLGQMRCGRENPMMDPKYIDEMVTTLPKDPDPN